MNWPTRFWDMLRLNRHRIARPIFKSFGPDTLGYESGKPVTIGDAEH